jgi:epoxyqueuosine reductase
VSIDALAVKNLARDCGFELVGIAPAEPSGDFARFSEWRASGMAGEMHYLTDYRGDLRNDPLNLLPSAKSIICVGKLYNTDHAHSTDAVQTGRGWISRYAWGRDYHEVLRTKLETLVAGIARHYAEPFAWRICVDTAPLLERSLASAAGLGWIGKNTCLINQEQGSWFFLGELLLSIPLDFDAAVPERCGSCTRCIDACPTNAIVPNADATWSVDSRLCISYLTIEKRGEIPTGLASKIANHLFGCDICQDVCPWNRLAPFTTERCFEPLTFAPALQELCSLSGEEFRALFRRSPVWRSRYEGFLRNVALAMGNSHRSDMQEPLRKLASHPSPIVSQAAVIALEMLQGTVCVSEPSSRPF